MDRKDGKESEEEIFLTGLRQSLDRMDHVLDQPSIPSKEQLKSQLHERLRKRRKFMMLELLLFWLVSLFVIGSGALVAYSAPWILLIIQAMSLVTAFVLVARVIIHRRKEDIR